MKKVRLIDFEAEMYGDWSGALKEYRRIYSDFFDYRDAPGENLQEWLEEADWLFFHKEQENFVLPLFEAEKIGAPIRRYFEFSGGDNFTAIEKPRKIGEGLYMIGRAGLKKVLPEYLKKLSENS